MDMSEIARALEASAIGTWVRAGKGIAPMMSGLHIMAIVFVFGTIFMVDLRLLGVAFMNRAFTRVHADLLRWTWIAFVLSAITGVLLITANATEYLHNVPIQIKFVLIVLAGINMFVFEWFTMRDVAIWDSGGPPPAAKAAAAISLILWILVTVFGRWVGYTKGVAVPEVDPGALGNFL